MSPRSNNLVIESERFDVLATDLPRVENAVLVGIRGLGTRHATAFLSPSDARRLANALICAANHYDRESARLEAASAGGQLGAAA